MDQLVAMRVFRRVVELEGFSAAARDLGYSNAAISKYVSDLEARLEAQLLTRTTRSMNLTETGRMYYDRCVHILEEIEQAEQEVGELEAGPRGTLRVNAPVSFGLMHLTPSLPSFLARYPDLTVNLSLVDTLVDVIEENVDVAVRGRVTMPDSSLIARRLLSIGRVVCAAPDYLAEHGTPERPEDLTDHNCLIYTPAPSPRDWTFEGADRSVTVRVDGNLHASNSLALREGVVSGTGIGFLPIPTVNADLKTGRAVALLEDFTADNITFYAVYPPKRHPSAKVRVFVDFLVETFGSRPFWEA